MNLKANCFVLVLVFGIVSILTWVQVGVCEARRGHFGQRPGLILPLQRSIKDHLGSERVTAPAPPAQFCVKLLLKVFKNFHPPSSHSPGKWKTFKFLSQGGKLLKCKKMTVPCSEKGREEKWVCPSFMIPYLWRILSETGWRTLTLRNQEKRKFIPSAICVLISAYNSVP